MNIDTLVAPLLRVRASLCYFKGFLCGFALEIGSWLSLADVVIPRDFSPNPNLP